MLSVGLRGLNLTENAMSRIIWILIATLALASITACTEVVVEDHYGECTADEQCPGTSVCLDGICVEPEEPVPACERYDWMGNNSTWYCWCQGENCGGTDIYPWSCPFDLLSSPGDTICGIQCHDHFWLSESMLLIDRYEDPPMIVIDEGHGLVTCTQYANLTPLWFFTASSLVDLADNRLVHISSVLSRPAIVVSSYRINDGSWIDGGFTLTYSEPDSEGRLWQVGQFSFPLAREALPSGTIINWRLEAHLLGQPAEDVWEGNQILQ